jgi:hypothetical protein
VIPHLIGLACDPLPGKPGQFDWAGIRQRAATGLFRMAKEAARYVVAHRPELVQVLEAWKQIDEDSGPMLELLKRDDPRISVVACFALAQAGRVNDLTALVTAYGQSKNAEVKWAIVESFSLVDTDWVAKNVLDVWVADNKMDDWLRRQQTCYLIQKTSLAAEVARAYLDGCLAQDSPALQGRALRAYGKLQDIDVEQWLRPMCEYIVCGGEGAPPSNHMNLAATRPLDDSLTRSAIETLRDIGDAESIDALRRGRTRLCGENELRQLSYEVTEQIYWRINSDLTRETVPNDEA